LPRVPGGRDAAGKLVPNDVKADDRILFGKWSGTEVKIDSVEYLIMKECDVMGCWLTKIPQKGR
jgi:chaperonin GroES